MPSFEEQIATDLHRQLTRRLESTEATASIAGAGLGWHCEARRGVFTCKIHCFAAPDAEYLTFFNRDSSEIAVARSSSCDQTVDAVAEWLEGRDLATLYARYPFIDREKRGLLQLRDDVLAAAPSLRDAAHCELVTKYADIVGLYVSAGDRSCKISFYGENPVPDAKFAWDECELFEFQSNDRTQLTLVLNRWLVDRATPSALRAEFPWLTIGDLADYYERGNPIEGEFLQSWSRIEDFYRANQFKFSSAVLTMIHAMRRAGYDRLLRAGQSMATLILSRSRRHGL